jgi:hypothetical protein
MQASCADEGTSNVKFHVVRYVSGQYGYWEAVCGTGADGATMMSHDTLPAASVSAKSRCKKPGCRKAFALADSGHNSALNGAAHRDANPEK